MKKTKQLHWLLFSRPINLLPLAFAALLAGTIFSPSAYAAEVHLEWNHSSTFSVDGYRVYWGTASGSYSHSYDVGLLTYHTIYDLNDQTRYYFAVTAYDGGVESGFSNEVSALAGVPSPDTGNSGGGVNSGGGGGSCTLNPEGGFGLEWLLLFLLTFLRAKRKKAC
jgi:uncharacterized membrane protein YgcG